MNENESTNTTTASVAAANARAERDRKRTTVIAALCIAVVSAGASMMITLAVAGHLSSDGAAAEVLADCVNSDGHVPGMIRALGGGAVPIGRAVTPEYIVAERGVSAIFVMQAYADALGRHDITAAGLFSTCEILQQESFRLWEETE